MRMELARADAEPLTDADAFEALFTRVVRPEGPLAHELAAVGWPPPAPAARYTTQLWRAVLDVACRHAFPGLPREAALRALGERWVDAFFHTATGRLIGATLPLVGPERAVRLLPRYMMMTHSGVDVVARAEGPGRWLLEARQRLPSPHFTAGYVQGGLRRTGAAGERVEVLEHGPGGYRLRLAWDAPALRHP